MEGNEDRARYYTTKHSWKGKYKRVFCVGSKGITTLNPASAEITNQWPYGEFIDITPSPKSNNEFFITMRTSRNKTNKMTFSCDHRADLLTEALQSAPLFVDGNRLKEKRFQAAKFHWSETKKNAILVVRRQCLTQVEVTGRKLADYNYKDIEYMAKISDHPAAFVIAHGGFGRLHMFLVDNRDELLRDIQVASQANIGYHVAVRKEPISHSEFQAKRLGKYSDDDCITSLTEFPVQKHSQRHTEPIPRTLALSESIIIERDPSTYAIVTIQPLSNVFALIRYPENPQNFSIEYTNGVVRRYTSTDRDALLCSILDGVRASGNKDVCVKMYRTNLGNRLGPLYIPVEEEVESIYLKLLGTAPTGAALSAILERFNCNIGYSGLNHAVSQEGLFTENKEKLILQAVQALLGKNDPSTSAQDLEAQFHSLRRLVASKAGYEAFTTLPNFRDSIGRKVVKALNRKDDGITHSCVDLLCTLMQPMHDNFDLRQEQMNKSSLLSSKVFVEKLLNVLQEHISLGTGALVINALLDFITFAICPPYSETTPGAMFDMVLELVANLGRYLFKLFQHPSLAIVKAAGLIMKAIIEEAPDEIVQKMQELAMAEGALPRHFHTALFTSSADNRLLTHRQLSRHLVSLWVTGNPTALALLHRTLPLGLIQYLDSDEKVPDEADRLHVRDNLKAVQLSRRKMNMLESTLLHWRSRLKAKPQPINQPLALRKCRKNIRPESNWALFYYKFMEDHSLSTLIWNYKTREELREALEAEIRSFTVDKDLSGTSEISWNHVEFEVRYESLADEIKIGDYYLRLLLDEGGSTKFVKPMEFFNDLYHRFLLSPKPSMKAMCLQAMSIVYGQCYEDIGPFNDTTFIVHKLERCEDKEERDRLLQFIDKLMYHKRNVKLFLDSNGMKILIDLLALAHLHTSRAYVPTQTNVLEAAPSSENEAAKEWYFGNRDKEREGPYSFREMKDLWAEGTIHGKTRCWAQGMEGWRPLDQIAQLKWNLNATGNALMNESEIARLILNMLIRICEGYPTRDIDGAVIRPLPRAKRMLSDPSTLPHLVQLLLTFDPQLVDKVVILLNNIMEDNPQLPRLFMSGVFFFILMYTGSNILPIAKFLKYSHMKQSFRPDTEQQQTSDIMLRSILGQLLPEAMVHFLENHGPEKFSSTFLGEFDTPEAIWNSEMRRMMIEKIAVHIADFTPRLLSNTRAIYQYCAIPIIQYPQLEDELFCNIYYLRHLCDLVKFPDWPIREPVKMLKDVLMEWKKEVEKKPPEMSVDQAYETLGLAVGVGGHEEAKVRKAYFKMAQKYHPDKNPEGRHVFEAVNKAYEFLCSKTSRTTQGPDPNRIVLLLKTQSILFTRCAQILQPYKYAGYPMLIKTIERETKDDDLFSKSAPILAASSELSYHTMNNSALNAEELCRENGIPILQAAFARCVSVLSKSSKEEDMAVQVCVHICRCYRVSAQFEICREAIVEVLAIVKDICRVLYYKDLPRLNTVATETVSAFARDEWLQTHLLHAGVLFHLLLFIFNYDYTLDESGVETNDSTNAQEVANNLARLSLRAVARLGGFKVTGDTEPATPYNKTIQNILSSLLTSYTTKLFSRLTISELLKILNSNTENPYLIWDNRTRAELTEYLGAQQTELIRTGEIDDATFGEDFKFSVLRDELVVGEVYVRVYNDQPTFVLEDNKGFAAALLDFVGTNAQYLHSLMALTASEVDTSKQGQHSSRLKNVEMSLEALYNVIRGNAGVEVQCLGHFKLLFSLLRVQGASKVQLLALQVISSVTGNKACVSNIADSNVLQYLLLVLHMLPSSDALVLEIFQALTSNTQIVKESIQKGALIYMLNLFCNSQNPTVREQTAALIAKMITDKLVGPKVRIVLTKFLPHIFMDAMRDSPEAAVVMFENTQENPELIWNDEAREKVSDVVRDMTQKFFERQKEDTEISWKLPDDFAVVYAQIQGEVEVGGVFLRLFIAQPNWVLRKPKEFLIAILEKFGQLIQSTNPDSETLETVTQAIVCLFTAQPAMGDQVPPLGHLPRIFERMNADNDVIPKACLEAVNVLSSSEFCVRSMIKINVMKPLIAAMRRRPDCAHTGADCVSKMVEVGLSELVLQALESEMVQFLLGLLESPLSDVEKPSAAKAIIAESLKTMSKDLLYGEKVLTILDGSKVWLQYKDQKHDLFITDTPIAGYLTGGVGGVAGYLTAGTSTGNTAGLSSPPPLKEPPDDMGTQEDD